MARGVGAEDPHPRFPDGPEEIGLELLALFIHLRKSAGGQDDGLDPAGGAISNRLGIGGGRQDDHG